MATKKTAPRGKATARSKKKPPNGMFRNPAKTKQTRAEVDRVLNGPARRQPKPAKPAKPRAARLPGLENIGTNKALSRICASLAEVRESKNDAQQQENGLLGNALREMQRDKRFLYRDHGVELVRKAGEEKVQLRLSKAQGTAEEEPAAVVDEGVDNGAGDGGEAEAGTEMPL